LAPRDYARLTEKSQIDRLRSVAIEACREFNVPVRSMRVLHHAFNTTFGIRAVNGDRFALRINVNSASAKSQIEAEIAWIQRLAQDAVIHVPRPVASPSGEFVLIMSPVGGSRTTGLPCVLYSWISGKMGYRVASEQTARMLGEATAKLHRHSENCPELKDIAFRPLPDLLFGGEFRLRSSDVFARVYQNAQKLWPKLLKNPRKPIHYDLHLGNVKLDRGRLFVFDFDDAVSAWPILDPTVTLHSLRYFKEAPVLEAAYWQGLGNRPHDYGFDDSEFETLVAARAILIANERSKYGSPQDLAFIDGVENRLLEFEKSGTYWPKAR
jgi:Ser/Thr protein kinase RdoA (MazF antagonist)